MSLNSARMPSLEDKINEQAEKEKLEREKLELAKANQGDANQVSEIPVEGSKVESEVSPETKVEEEKGKVIKTVKKTGRKLNK